jgi:hypothetical protein
MHLPSRVFWWAVAAWLAFVVIMAHAAFADDMPKVDVALVLAVDVSSSVTKEEAALQRAGYAAAILSPEVLKAIQGGLYGSIAMTYMEWSGQNQQKTIVPWQIIRDQHDAIAFVSQLRPPQHFEPGGNTALGDGLHYATQLMSVVPVSADRHVIDMSGDGRSNEGLPVEPARLAAIAAGITINGLPIEMDPLSTEARSIEAYYREFVIGGPGAFVLASSGGPDFQLAVRTKIATEVAGLPAVQQFAGAE